MEGLRHLWTLYKRDGNIDHRNKLWEHYVPLVKYHAQRIAAKLPAVVELDDLTSAGCFGLMEALSTFEPERGVKFETYSARRIRGAILDHLRSMDWAPRLVRSRAQMVNEVRERVAKRLGRPPTENEIAAGMRLSSREHKRVRSDSEPVRMVSLSRSRYTTDSDKQIREIDMLADKKQPSPISEIERRDLRDFLTRRLSRAERLVVMLYYVENMTMREIGLTLDLSESRVSQMHSSILARMRALLGKRWEDQLLATVA